jgi:hypothetical protein
VNAELIRQLPTPLATAYATHHFGGHKDVGRLFRLLESTLFFMDNVLRALAMDYSDLQRPASLGFRLDRIGKLSERYDYVGIASPGWFANDKPRIERLVRLRNRWAHEGTASPQEASSEMSEVESGLDAILEPLRRLELLLTEKTGDEITAYRLMGLRGLFEPETVTVPASAYEVVTSALDSDLCIRVAEELVSLHPFMRARKGVTGENRVDLLAKANFRGYDYIDATGDFYDR